MKKLYIFGDSFSLFDNSIKDYHKETIEFNSHSSLSNDHILKIAKLKLLKLIKNKVKGVHMLLQLTVANRLLILHNPYSEYTTKELEGFKYQSSQLEYADKELFEDSMYFSLYPLFSTTDNILIDSIYAPYSNLICSHNEKIMLKDWMLEIDVLYQLAKSNGINLEYIFYPDDYDKLFKLNKIKSSHIQIDGFNSIETYIKSTNPSYFISNSDIHFTEEGCKWYINFLKTRYDI